MKYKIGVYGSAVNESEQSIVVAKQLGQELAKHDVIVVTGACSGMPYIVAYETKQHGSEIWGFSPVLDDKSLKELYPEDDTTIYSKVFHIPQSYKELFFVEPDQDFKVQKTAFQKYRNVISTANVDAGIIISGRWGTMHEFCSLYDMGKVIGVLTGTGGIADEIEQLQTKINKKTDAIVVYNSSPEELINKVLAELDKRLRTVIV